ncbi:LysE family translocator [Ignatzschineria rhizosphaerae]|uniref:LysE family translocator n=1 Tax=Ignatzschineria rhizosphaerae TaxID=2923279 RepID=A0ABY3WYZ5_9GAMM|nr:LysE family translocator [Ignatzschineria rhizosphaerae]UNM95834.1 LysE family translocator [Ignatzschineria rhizosphaerae]
MDFGVLLTFWTVSFLFVMTPGADWAYAISAGIRGKVVLPAVSGMLMGHFLATIIVALGIGAILAKNPMIMLSITMFGAAYLLWLGIGLVRSPSRPSSAAMTDISSSKSWAIKGFFVSGLNPKVLLLFLALLPQFTDPNSSWDLSIQLILLGLIHIFSSFIVYSLVGYGSQTVLQTRPLAAEIISRVSGILMVVIAGILIFGQIRDYF